MGVSEMDKNNDISEKLKISIERSERELERLARKDETKIIAKFIYCNKYSEVISEESGQYTLHQFIRQLRKSNVHNIEVWCYKNNLYEGE